MRSVSLLVATLGLSLLATACGSAAAPSSTPTATRETAASRQATFASAQPATSAPTALPTMDAARLNDWKIYVQVIYGCECSGPPAAGIIDVIAIPPSQVEAANLTPITAEIGHPSMSKPFYIPLAFNDRLIDSCGIDYSGTLRGYSGSERVLTEKGLPRTGPNYAVLPADPPVSVWFVVEDDVQQRYRVNVTPTQICAAVS